MAATADEIADEIQALTFLSKCVKMCVLTLKHFIEPYRLNMADDEILVGKYPMNPHVTAVIANDDHTLTLTFTNSEVRWSDMKPWLDRGVFRELQNIGYFRCARIAFGTVEWPNEQDLCPNMLYLDSEPVEAAVVD